MKNYQLTDVKLPDINKSIIATLAYFDVFNYPLTKSELFLFLGKRCTNQALAIALNSLANNNLVYKFDNFYTLNNRPEIAANRRERNIRAAGFIKAAQKISQALIKIPYVRGIAVSGSLSKKVNDEPSNIQLLIITAPNRMSIARAFINVFKKLNFCINKQNCFCVSYIVDEQCLEIAEKNIDTATEIVTLIPLQGDLVFSNFYRANAWTTNYLPNNYMRVSTAKPLKNNYTKNFVELMLNNRLGKMLNNVLLKKSHAGKSYIKTW